MYYIGSFLSWTKIKEKDTQCVFFVCNSYQHTMSCSPWNKCPLSISTTSIIWIPYPSWYGPNPTSHNINRGMLTLQKTGQKSDFPEKSENVTDWPTDTGAGLSLRKSHHIKTEIFSEILVLQAMWSLYTVLFSLSVSLAPKNAPTKFHAWKLDPVYTISTFQSDYSLLSAHCA